MPLIPALLIPYDRSSALTLTSYIKLFAGGKLSLIHDYFSIPVFFSLLISLGALIGAAFLFRHPETDDRDHVNRRAIAFLWLWFLTYAIFLASWDPGSAFHKLFVWPPIVLLIGAYVADRPALRQRSKALLALAVALAAWNFGAFIYPHSHASADPVLSLALTVDRQLPKNATVYYRVLAPDDWYLEYFAPGRFWSPLQVRSGSVYIGITNHPAGPTCFETTALDLLDKAPAVASHIDPARRWDLLDSRHRIRLECLKTGSEP